MTCSITATDNRLKIVTPYSPENARKLSALPDHRTWDDEKRAWFAKPTRRNVEHLMAAFPDAAWSDVAEQYRLTALSYVEATAQARDVKSLSLPLLTEQRPDDYKHGGPPPFDWQRRALAISRDMPAYAVFAEQRLGKTKLFIDTAARQFTLGKVRQALVLAPNSVKTNWVTDEIPTHMPDYVKWRAAYWQASPLKAERAALDAVLASPSEDEMTWLVMNIEALSTKRGAAAALAFVKQAPTIVGVDESTRIKTPRSKRTMAVLALRKHAPYRRIMTGTPATQGPLDLYAQFEFLDPNILGFGSWYGFRNHFAIMGGWNGKVVVGYQHLDELQRLIDPYSFRITRAECFDIPPKGYQKLIVDMTPEQARLYSEMRRRMRAELGNGQTVTAQMAITQLLRLAQIAGGFAPVDPNLDDLADRALGGNWGRTASMPIEGGNPKVDALLELAEDVQGKVIVWARFRAEIAAAADALRERFGPDSVAEFHGGVNDAGRIEARTKFQDPQSSVRFLVGQTEVGGLGINLDQARTIAYLSNSFSLESRLQSEDRPMSSRQKHSVAVVDIMARGTVDERVVAALRNKQDVARAITGDAWKEWI